ncbi:hypothetical protein GR243_18350 [Rhizobium leguminosarum]|nr:hypothetical protein [Rhizobium leguminosarum]
MARSRFIYTLKEVAVMIGENLELIDEARWAYRSAYSSRFLPRIGH